jgi:hypothetical protein
MSGGTYDYFYGKLEDLIPNIREDGGCSAASPAMRRAFKSHLWEIAAALRAIEWNDSGDGDNAERDLLFKILGATRPLEEAIKHAVKARNELHAEIERASAVLAPKEAP